MIGCFKLLGNLQVRRICKNMGLTYASCNCNNWWRTLSLTGLVAHIGVIKVILCLSINFSNLFRLKFQYLATLYYIYDLYFEHKINKYENTPHPPEGKVGYKKQQPWKPINFPLPLYEYLIIDIAFVSESNKAPARKGTSHKGKFQVGMTRILFIISTKK